MTKTYDVAVIGGGLIGAAITYYCSRQGMSTVLLEKSHLAAGGSGGNFGLVLPSTGRMDIPFSLECERKGAERIARMSEELDFDIEYRPAHGYCLLCTDEELAAFKAHCDNFVKAGLGERILTPKELHQAEPNMYIGPEVIAALETDEGVLNPMRLVLGFWKAARRYGAELLTDTPAIGFKVQPNRITHVLTPQGEVPVGQVVISAGSWTRQVALTLNVSLPEYYIQSEALITEPLPPLLNGFAYWGNVQRMSAETRIGNESMTVGWESRGNEHLFEAYDFGTVQTRQGHIMLGQLSYVTPPFDNRASYKIMPGSAWEAMRMLPQLKKAKAIRSWRSPAPFTPDHLPLLGRMDTHDNLYIASGLQSAVSGCPWAGELVADMLSGKPVPEEAKLFNPNRFSQPIAI